MDIQGFVNRPLFKIGDFTVNVLSAIIAGLVVFWFTRKR